MIRLAQAKFPDDEPAVRELFLEYADSLPFSLRFQNWEHELANLAEEYGPPTGCLILAFEADIPAACVALRSFSESVCEMKRLYVRPACRGLGLGKRLARTIVAEARKLKYQRMVLDTVPQMTEAVALYRALGFREIPPYRFNPMLGALFMELTL
ncbi:MAG TPA: GNAT family N-acetyltransferase [bacterium]|jgi:ribosomal protein S18 acetylase RimI-like enzyme